MKDNHCLICLKKTRDFKNWYKYKIFNCHRCSFLFIRKNTYKDKVFSETEQKFLNNSIINDQERAELFKNKIVSNRIEIYKKILKRKPLNILEVGCGSGVISEGFLKNKIHYTGIEYNRKIYNFAKKKSRNVIYGDFFKTNFKKKFDIVFASQVLEHVENPNLFFKKCNQVLSKNGILHIDVPNNESIISILRKIFKNNKYYGALRPPYHLRAYSQKSIKKLFMKNNFYNLKVFSKFNLDRTYGQNVEKIPLKIRLIFFLQSLTGKNSLLVGLAQKK